MKKLVLIGMLLISSFAYSQIEKGDVALTFNGSYLGTEDYSFGLFSAKVGRYFTQNIEAGITPQLQLGEGFSAFGLGAYGTYNFLTADAKLLPYAGGSLNIFTQSFDGADSFNSTDAGLYGGSKYFLTETLNIDANINYTFNLANSQDVDLGGTFIFNIGVGFIFGKLK